MNDSQFNKSASRLMLLCWLAYATSYVTKLCYPICMDEMVTKGIFSSTFGGAVVTAMYASYGIGQLINGWLGDKISPKFMIGFGLGCSSLMNVFMGIFEDKAILLVVWCLNGFFTSMLWAPVIRCVSEFLPKEKQAKAGGTLSATYPCGSITVYALGAICFKLLSYKAVFICAGIIGGITTTVWLIGTTRLKDYFRLFTLSASTSEPVVKERANLKKFAIMLASTGAVVAAVCILFNGVLKDGVNAWTHTYLVTYFGISDSLASTLLLMLPIINLAGAFSAIRINTKLFKNEFLTCAVMFGVSLISISLLLITDDFSAVLAVILFALSSAAMLGANTMLLTFIPMKFSSIGRAATLTGLLDAFSYIASAISGVTTGKIKESLGWNATVISWIILAGCGVLASLLIFRKWKNGQNQLVNG